MREILFRGKLDNGKWVYGYLGKHTSLDAMIIDRPYVTMNDDLAALNFWMVDPSTVGQYTGLKDKNGKRIFEGDIVRYYELQFDGKDAPVCDAVVYEDGGFAVSAYFLDNWLWDSAHGNIQLRDVEVIGNIHDNQELLKGGGESK